MFILSAFKNVAFVMYKQPISTSNERRSQHILIFLGQNSSGNFFKAMDAYHAEQEESFKHTTQ